MTSPRGTRVPQLPVKRTVVTSLESKAPEKTRVNNGPFSLSIWWPLNTRKSNEQHFRNKTLLLEEIGQSRGVTSRERSRRILLYRVRRLIADRQSSRNYFLGRVRPGVITGLRGDRIEGGPCEAPNFPGGNFFCFDDHCQ